MVQLSEAGQLKDRTPASVAGIRFPYRNWKDVTEQPYEVTARIPIRKPEAIVISTRHKVVRRAKKKKARKSPRSTPPMLSLTQMRR